MNIRNLIQVGMIGAALAITASAQQYDHRDMRRRDELARKVEADRRAVEHEQRELRHSNWANSGHESRELRQAEDRLNRDSAELAALENHRR